MKAVARGFGVMVPVEQVGIRAAPVLATLTEVLSNASFKEAATKISVRMRARPRTPLEEAAGEPFEWLKHYGLDASLTRRKDSLFKCDLFCIFSLGPPDCVLGEWM